MLTVILFQCDWHVCKAWIFDHHSGWKLHYWKSSFSIYESSGWISNESMMVLGRETLSTIKLSVVKLLKWEALKEGSLCLSSVIDFPSAISKVLLLPHSLYLFLSVIPTIFAYLSPSAWAHHLPQPSSRLVLINQACRQHEEQGYVNVPCQEHAALCSCLLVWLLVFLPASLPCCLPVWL